MLISLSSFDTLSSKIARINKRLSKKNLPLITYTHENEVHTFGELFSKATIEHYNFSSYWAVEVVNFKITSDIKNWIIESGYEIVAVVDHAENMIHNFIEDIDVEYFRYRHYCDHCHTKRNRSKSIILRNKEGKFIQVGTTCLSDFINANVDELVHGMSICAEDFRISEKDENEFFGNSHREYIQFSIFEAIPVIYRSIMEYGFIPSSQGMSSTKMFVYKVLSYEEELAVKDEDKNIAPKIVEWISSLDNTNSFTGNLIQIVKNGFVSPKTLGYLCACVKSYITDYVKKNEPSVLSEYVGNIGDKIVSEEVTLTNVNYFDGFYGMVGIFIFKNNDGNIFMWKTSTDIEYKIGDNLTINGTIKEHSEYRGTKQTVLTRVKVVK